MNWNLEGIDNIEGANPELVSKLRRQLAEEWLREVKAAEDLVTELTAINLEYEASLRQLGSDRQWEKYKRLHRRRIRLMAPSTMSPAGR